MAASNSSRVTEIKSLMYSYGKDGLEAGMEGALYCGLLQAFIAMYYIAIDHPSFSPHNWKWGFVASILNNLYQMFSLYCFMHSDAGPSSATFQT